MIAKFVVPSCESDIWPTIRNLAGKPMVYFFTALRL